MMMIMVIDDEIGNYYVGFKVIMMLIMTSVAVIMIVMIMMTMLVMMIMMMSGDKVDR